MPSESGAFPQEFNKGIFDYLIATDDPAKREEHAELTEPAEARAEDPQPLKSGKKRKGIKAPQQQQQQQQQRKRPRKAGADEEFGVIRGIDFKGVRTVINVDAPDTAEVSVIRSLHMIAWTRLARLGAVLGLERRELGFGVIRCIETYCLRPALVHAPGHIESESLQDYVYACEAVRHSIYCCAVLHCTCRAAIASKL